MTLTTQDLNRRIWLSVSWPVMQFSSRRTIPVAWNNQQWDQEIQQPMKHCKIVTKGAGHSVMHELVDHTSNTIIITSSYQHRRILKMRNIKLLNANQPFPETNKP